MQITPVSYANKAQFSVPMKGRINNTSSMESPIARRIDDSYMDYADYKGNIQKARIDLNSIEPEENRRVHKEPDELAKSISKMSKNVIKEDNADAFAQDVLEYLKGIKDLRKDVLDYIKDNKDQSYIDHMIPVQSREEKYQLDPRTSMSVLYGAPGDDTVPAEPTCVVINSSSEKIDTNEIIMKLDNQNGTYKSICSNKTSFWEFNETTGSCESHAEVFHPSLNRKNIY